MAAQVLVPQGPTLFGRLNTSWHRTALSVFAVIVVLHWAEHLVQAYQIWVLDKPRPAANGMIGFAFPWLVRSEWLHFGYAIVMAATLVLLLPGFTGRARRIWIIALVIQAWHFIEHLLLFYQAQTDQFLADRTQPTSILQLVFPGARPEIHLFYNALVTIPMIVALYFHMYPPRRERVRFRQVCSCAHT